jgi:hypothetical protein
MSPPIHENSDDVVTYKQLQREPASREHFNNRITTLQGLCSALNDSAFLAIDTEHVAIASEKDRILHQVGLAYVQTLVQEDSPQSDHTSSVTSQPYLQNFYTNNQIHALTLNININKKKKMTLFVLGGARACQLAALTALARSNKFILKI